MRSMKCEVNRKIFVALVYPCLVLIFMFSSNLSAMAWTVAPVRFEIKGQKGKEYTLTFSVLNESQLYEKRFEIQTDDWIINKNNDFLRKAFTPEIENKYSATSWIKVTPMQFMVPPGETKNIRFTISVPDDVAIDGDYSAGIFVGEKNIEKPPKGEKIVHIKQDTFIGVIVYVKLGEEKHSLTLKNLEVKSKPVSNGLNKVTILPTYESRGNVHARGQVQVKFEPTSKTSSEIKEINAGEVVVLRESAVTYPIDLPDPLPANSEWKITVKTDFGSHIPVLIGAKTYKVPFIEMPVVPKQEIKKKTKESHPKIP